MMEALVVLESLFEVLLPNGYSGSKMVGLLTWRGSGLLWGEEVCFRPFIYSFLTFLQRQSSH